MNPKSSGLLAAEISEEIATHFTSLNAIISKNKTHWSNDYFVLDIIVKYTSK